MENNGNNLAKLSIGINVLLIIAVIILFVKMPSSSSNDTADTTEPDSNAVSNPVIADDGKMNIAYFSADSLNNNLLLMTELEGLIEQASVNAQDRITRKENELRKWEESWSTGGQLLPSEQERYMQEAQQKQQEYGMLQQEVQMELAQQQEQHMFTLISRVSKAAKDYAEENGFDYVFSYTLGQSLYYGSPNFDITEELIDIMNEDYKKKSAPVEETSEEE